MAADVCFRAWPFQSTNMIMDSLRGQLLFPNLERSAFDAEVREVARNPLTTTNPSILDLKRRSKKLGRN